jgi:hypothetical protein
MGAALVEWSDGREYGWLRLNCASFIASGLANSSNAWLVHPAFIVGVLAEFVGVDVAAVFVEVDFAVLLAHVDLELAGGAAALPAVVVVAEAEVALAEAEGETAAGGELDVEEAAECAGELEEGVEGVGLFEQKCDGDEDVDGDHVLRLDADEEPEEKFLVSEDHGDGDEEAKDSGPAAGSGDVGAQVENVGEGDRRGEECAADDGGAVEFGEPATAKGGLEERAGEPEGEHAEEDAEEAVVDEGVGEELPDFAVEDGEWFEQEMASEEAFEVRCEPAEENDREEGANVRKNELAGDASEGRQAERDGTGAGHVCFLISS